MLADYGADVVRVEPPSGDPGRSKGPFPNDEPGRESSAYYLFYNTNKLSITLNLETSLGRSIFKQLAEKADVVVESLPVGYLKTLGLDYESLSESNPGLVMASISPFGQTGPYSRYRAHDLAIVAMGGNASMTGEPDGPPTRCSMPTSHFHAAPEAALGILMALYARLRTGRGQLVDVSMQECQLDRKSVV